MKLIVNRNQLSETPESFLRRAGYAFIHDRKTGQDSFALRLGNYHYPRLHMYVEARGQEVSFNLHLDQKQASYAGQHMHSAEYDGPVVEQEIARLKSYVFSQDQAALHNKQMPVGQLPDASVRIGYGDFRQAAKKENKKPWWRHIFGF